MESKGDHLKSSEYEVATEEDDKSQGSSEIIIAWKP